MSSPKINIGVIGCGVIGQYHLAALQNIPAARIHIIADQREDLAQEMAKRFGAARYTADGMVVATDDDVDAVIIALPTCARHPFACAALSHGKHLLLEKPVAMNAQQVLELLDLQQDQIAACCSSRFRALPAAAIAHACIKEGRIGKPRVLRCSAMSPAGPPPKSPPPAWRASRSLNGGGIFVNWGSYDLDFLLGLLDFSFKPKHALASAWSRPDEYSAYVAPDSDAESHLAATITSHHGPVIHYERAEFIAAPRRAIWEITGDRGTLKCEIHGPGEARVSLFHADPTSGVAEETLWTGDSPGAGIHKGPIADFIAAIQQNRKPLTSLADALLLAQITGAVYASCSSGSPIQI